MLEVFHEVFPGFSSKAKVSSTIEKNDLSQLPKDVADKYKDSPEWTDEQINGIQNYLKGIQSGEIEGNMDEDFHVNSDDYALEHNIFGRPLGGGKPEIDEKLVAGSEFVFDFFIGDDVNTVLDSEASLQDRILAGISIVPAGKVLKLARKIKNVDKVVDGGKDVKSGTKDTGNSIQYAETGGRNISPEQFFKEEAIAEEMYEKFRNLGTEDVNAIAKNTGFSVARIQRIKDHVFNNSHIKDHGVGRFDPDYELAQAWQRLIDGKQVDSDIQLLHHEIFESKFEGIFQTNYRTAHDKTIESGRPWNWEKNYEE